MRNNQYKEHETIHRERTVFDSFCVEPDCEYNGRPAVQGHCYHKPDDETDIYVNKVFKQATEEIEWMRQHYGEKYNEYLESMYHHAVMSRWFDLDALIKLRYENAKLKHELDKLKNARTD